MSLKIQSLLASNPYSSKMSFGIKKLDGDAITETLLNTRAKAGDLLELTGSKHPEFQPTVPKQIDPDRVDFSLDAPVEN